ncbi:MAG: hypothetical protein ABI678_28275, partial [Kofleriaceae bacterium]
TLGTASLLEGCRRAIAKDADLLSQLEKFVDIHLQNAKSVGRLIFVLGGEASRWESPLHARRMEVHEAITQMISEHPEAEEVDPMLIRTLVFAIEATVRQILQDGDEGRRVTADSVARARRVLLRIVTATVAGNGPRIAPMPVADR